MQKEIDDFVAMNTNGLVLELCEKYYAEDVLMLNNGDIFARSMKESFDKQKSFISKVTGFDVKLISSNVTNNIAELAFKYKITGSDSIVNEFSGKHIQTWENGKIVREEYLSIEQA